MQGSVAGLVRIVHIGARLEQQRDRFHNTALFTRKLAISAIRLGVFHQIQKRVPEKVLLQAPGMDESCECNRCPFMRLNTLEKLYCSLRELEPRVEVPEAIRLRALVPIERMLELS